MTKSAEERLNEVAKEMQKSLRKEGKRIELRIVTPEIRYGESYIIEATSSTKQMNDFEVIKVVTRKLFDLSDVALRRHVSHVRVV